MESSISFENGIVCGPSGWRYVEKVENEVCQTPRFYTFFFRIIYPKNIRTYPPGYSSWKLDRPVWISDQMLFQRAMDIDPSSFEYSFLERGIPRFPNLSPRFFFGRIESLLIRSEFLLCFRNYYRYLFHLKRLICWEEIVHPFRIFFQLLYFQITFSG